MSVLLGHSELLSRAVLLGLGTLTLKSARRPRELPFAAIPLLFAIQHLGEGVIWLTFSSEHHSNVAALPGAPFILTAGLAVLGLLLRLGLPHLLMPADLRSRRVSA